MSSNYEIIFFFFFFSCHRLSNRFVSGALLFYTTNTQNSVEVYSVMQNITSFLKNCSDVYCQKQAISNCLKIGLLENHKGLMTMLPTNRTKDVQSFQCLQTLPLEKWYDNMNPRSRACVCGYG